MLYLLTGLWLLGLLIGWALVAIGREPLPPDALAERPTAAVAGLARPAAGRAARRAPSWRVSAAGPYL